MMYQKKRHLRSCIYLPAIITVVMLSTVLSASGTQPEAYPVGSRENAVIEVYNDTTKLSLANEPFLQDYEIYLPIRETLNWFGIYDIQWDNGKITIELPLLDNYKGFATQESGCQLVLGSVTITYASDKVSYRDGVIDPDPDAGGFSLRYPPISRDGVAYATVEFFEDLICHGQLPRFHVRLLQSTDPKDYYAEGEAVFIGTGEVQKAYHPVDEAGNTAYLKRIVVNEQGEALFVIPAAFQDPEIIASLPRLNSASMEGYTKVRSRTFCYNAYGEEVLLSSGIFVYERQGNDELKAIAYIPPALQINGYAYGDRYWEWPA